MRHAPQSPGRSPCGMPETVGELRARGIHLVSLEERLHTSSTATSHLVVSRRSPATLLDSNGTEQPTRLAQTIRISAPDLDCSARTTLMATNRDGLPVPKSLFMIFNFSSPNWPHATIS